MGREIESELFSPSSRKVKTVKLSRDPKWREGSRERAELCRKPRLSVSH